MAGIKRGVTGDKSLELSLPTDGELDGRRSASQTRNIRWRISGPWGRGDCVAPIETETAVVLSSDWLTRVVVSKPALCKVNDPEAAVCDAPSPGPRERCLHANVLRAFNSFHHLGKSRKPILVSVSRSCGISCRYLQPC
jgi:hypothetical protein